jgi:hypothetical protein
MLTLLSLIGCQPVLEMSEREAGVRAPLTAACDEQDELACLLPWPSNVYTAADPTSPTGLRLAVQESSLSHPESVDYLNRSDGFSRITGIGVAFDAEINADALSFDPVASLDPEAPVQVFDTVTLERKPYRTEWIDAGSLSGPRAIVIGRPAAVLAPNRDHVGIVLDTIGVTTQPRPVRIALGLDEPETQVDANLYGYHAPTRALLDEVGIDPARVVRVFDFTTRSAGDATFRLHAMMDTLGANMDALGVEIDSVVFPAEPAIAYILRGRLTGAPGFLDADGQLVLDAEGRPQVVDDASIEFRFVVPAGTGDYPVALYGHGTGGNVSDPSFDVEFARAGIGKLALRFTGWTDEDFISTLLGFTEFLNGSARSTAGLMQALAGGTVLLTSLDGILDRTVSASTIDGVSNPAAGRHPDTSRIAWLGGSMGGTMGGVLVSADPRLQYAVLNVPGSAWTHMVPHSLLYTSGIESILQENYPNPIDLHLAMLIAQNNWDEVDGAPWADEALEAGGMFLLQQSMGDPVVPGLGTELLANAFGAVQLEPSLSPVHGLTPVTGDVTSGAALEQFRVPPTGAYDIHGFAARQTPAGAAALHQILAFLQSAWAGAPVMRHAELCAEQNADGRCDYSEAW